jgi:hypothetical protein
MFNVHATWREDIKRFELKTPLITPEINIPVGFLSDGFTGYWFTRWYVPRVGHGWFSAWVHDYCYVEAVNSKAWADRLFYKNLIRAGVRKPKARLMYLAVKVFGKGNY